MQENRISTANEGLADGKTPLSWCFEPNRPQNDPKTHLFWYKPDCRYIKAGCSGTPGKRPKHPVSKTWLPTSYRFTATKKDRIPSSLYTWFPVAQGNYCLWAVGGIAILLSPFLIIICRFAKCRNSSSAGLNRLKMHSGHFVSSGPLKSADYLQSNFHSCRSK